jgi:hypothetical protein
MFVVRKLRQEKNDTLTLQYVPGSPANGRTNLRKTF